MSSESKKASKSEPWYAKDGLKFTCTECGDCCTGAPGYVWVNADEIAAMAARLKISILDFEAKFTRKVGARRTLIEYDNGDCVLSQGSQVHSLRRAAPPMPDLAILGFEH